MKCSKCETPLKVGAKFCNTCGEKVTSEKQTGSINFEIFCNKCGKNVVVERPKTSFLGFSTIKCDKCGYKNEFKLNNSRKTIYYALAFFFLVGIYNLLVGQPFGGLSIFGLLASIALYTHYTLKEPEIVEGNHPNSKDGKDRSILYATITVIGLLLVIRVFNSDFGSTSDNSSVTSYFTSETWKPFNSTEAQFKVNFPTYPTSSSDTQDIEGIKYVSTQYSSDGSDGNNYSIVYGYYPGIASTDFDPKGGLEGAINGMVSTDNTNKLLSSNFITYKGHMGADFLVYNGTEKMYIRGRVLSKLKGSEPAKLYVLLVVTSNKDPDQNYNKFVESFELQ